MTIIRDKFGGEKDHKEKGNNLIFDLDRLEQMGKIYKDDGKIKTVLNDDPDSLTHPNTDSRGESGSESVQLNPDSQMTHSRKGSLSESVNQVGREIPDSHTDPLIEGKCPHCDYIEKDPFFMKIHRKNAHEGGL